MLKKAKILIIGLILIVYTILPTLSVSAEIIEEGIITIGKITANTGDTVIVPITFTENPGISAITISITYNSSALDFIEDINGDVIGDCETRAHPDKNIIRLVASKRGTTNANGTLISLKFKIADNAPPQLHKIDISYNSGDFCNWNLDRIMPTVVSGGVEVILSKSNCHHSSYSEWKTATVPSCLGNGAEQRICSACGHLELRDTPPIGHEFSKDFTIDKEATKTENGVMSRHCIRCNETTDEITYSLEQSEEGNFDNSFDTTIPSTDYIDDIYNEQYPDKEPDNQNQSSNSNSQNKPNEEEANNNNISSSSNKKEDKPLSNSIRDEIPELDTIFLYIKIAIIILLVLMLI